MNPLKIIPQKNWLTAALLAVFVHLFLFFGSGMAFVQKAQYGVDASQGGIEVSLIAALPATAEEKVLEKKEQEEKKEEEIIEEVEKQEKQIEKTKEETEKKDYTVKNDTGFIGNGSSEIPGESPITFSSKAGSSTDKSGHLSNPPPPYPAAAVQKGQEGLVVLAVVVDTSGRPKKVEIKTRSGYRLLDESAVKTVKKWKFNPARAGLMVVESVVEVPIRFVLKDELERRKAR